MQQKLQINGVDFAMYINESGVSFGTIPRVSRSIITLDGREIRKEIEKRSISVELYDWISDRNLAPLIDALKTTPASVIYTDRDGTEKAGTFYVSGLTATAKKVIGETTHYEGVSFQLEER